MLTRAVADFDSDSSLQWTTKGLLFRFNEEKAVEPSIFIGASNTLAMIGQPVDRTASGDESYTKEDRLKVNSWFDAFMGHTFSDEAGISNVDKEAARSAYTSFFKYGVIRVSDPTAENHWQAGISIFPAGGEEDAPAVKINLRLFEGWNNPHVE